MRLTFFCALSAGLLLPASALAAADLSVSTAGPPGVHVYEAGQYSVNVYNGGNTSAYNVSVSIQLPTTHTSPQVYALGDVGGYSGGTCSLTGTVLTCGLGTIQKKKTKTVLVTLTLPQSSAPIQIVSTASSSPVDSNPANNVSTFTASLAHYPYVISGPMAATNRHCTGTGLTSFFECEKFPSSISSHDTILEADGSITFIGVGTDYTGAWSQPATDRLFFQYF
jgi:hypothetical protein